MRVAVLGTGKIVHTVLPALTEAGVTFTDIWELEAFQERAEELAKEYGIPRVYTDYDLLLQETDADFVYVGLVNSAHYEFARKALLAGHDVILEKPFCTGVEEAKKLAELAVEKGRYLFEAVSCLHMPNFYGIREDIKKLGRIRLVLANYSQFSSRYENYKKGIIAPAFDPKFYGGALYDINIYNLNLAVALFGAPTEVIYRPNMGPNGVDLSGTVQMFYPDFQCFITGAKDCDGPGYFTVEGEDGWLSAKGAPNVLKEYEVCLRGGEPELKRLNTWDHRLVHEFLEFDETVRAGDYERMKQGLDVSIKVMETVAAAVASADLRFGE